MVQEAAVALVSTAAEACQDEDFGRYYDVVMPFLMQVRVCLCVYLFCDVFMPFLMQVRLCLVCVPFL